MNSANTTPMLFSRRTAGYRSPPPFYAIARCEFRREHRKKIATVRNRTISPMRADKKCEIRRKVLPIVISSGLYSNCVTHIFGIPQHDAPVTVANETTAEFKVHSTREKREISFREFLLCPALCKHFSIKIL